MSTEGDEFAKSTHSRYWLFTKEKLNELREEARLTVHDPLDPYKREKRDPNSDKLLSVEEELAVVRCTEIKLIQMCSKLKASDTVVFVALTFLKRYYLYHSTTTWNPIAVAVACIFLSEKLQEGKQSNLPRIMNATDFADATKEQLSKIIIKWLEADLLHGLKFHLRVYLPFRPLNGFIHEIATASFKKFGSNSRSAQYWKTWKTESKSLIVTAMRSDAPLLFSPSQIALASIRTAAYVSIPQKKEGNEKKENIEAFSIENAKEDFENFVSELELDEIMNRLIEIEPYLLTPISIQNSQEVLDKRKKCQNPLFLYRSIASRAEDE